MRKNSRFNQGEMCYLQTLHNQQNGNQWSKKIDVEVVENILRFVTAKYGYVLLCSIKESRDT